MFIYIFLKLLKAYQKKKIHYYHFVEVIKNDPSFSSWIPLLTHPVFSIQVNSMIV